MRNFAHAVAMVVCACSSDDACRVKGPAMDVILAEARANPYNEQVNRAAIAEWKLIEACEAIASHE